MTFNLSAGYICNDQNMISSSGSSEHCIDMKVRYCCVKMMRAQWSEWGQWSECTLSCGCGQQTRKKTCRQSKYRKKGTLGVEAYNPNCVGEESEAR